MGKAQKEPVSFINSYRKDWNPTLPWARKGLLKQGLILNLKLGEAKQCVEL